MIKRKLWTWLKNGNEYSISIMLNTWRWFLPLGYEGRRHNVVTNPGTIQKRTSIGFLCFMVIYTRFNKLSPYTQFLCNVQDKEKNHHPDYNPKNNLASMPQKYLGQFFNACTEPCDILQGPCACGATHHQEEWPDEIQEEVFGNVSTKESIIKRKPRVK